MCTVTKIFWKRTYLFVEFEAEKPVGLCLKNISTGRIVSFDVKELKSGYYRAKLNITIANGRNLLEEGTWELIQNDGNEIRDFSKCIKENPYIGQRVFRYTKRFYSYIFRTYFDEGRLLISNGHYMSVKKRKNEEIFCNDFFE